MRQQEIFRIEKTDVAEGRVLFDRYDRITGRHSYTLWNTETGEERYIDSTLADTLKRNAAL